MNHLLLINWVMSKTKIHPLMKRFGLVLNDGVNAYRKRNNLKDPHSAQHRLKDHPHTKKLKRLHSESYVLREIMIQTNEIIELYREEQQ